MSVYVAGPYRLGHRAANVRTAIAAGDAPLRRGHWPYVPHLHHAWDALHPHVERTWLELDLRWFEVSNAVLRLPGRSDGADRDGANAARPGIPVFTSIDALVRRRDP